MKCHFSKFIVAAVLGFMSLTSVSAFATETDYKYAVTITNLTRGQSFTPFLVASHKPGISLFTEGSPASPELAQLAEGGATAPLAGVLNGLSKVKQTATSGGLLGPGQSTTVIIKANSWFNQISLAAMLVPTNDGFVSVEGVRVPYAWEKVVEVLAPAYDAGSEPNDELCLSVPGPVCGGEGSSPNAGGEGYVHIHAGIHGIGDLAASDRDWRNPVAKISIQRVQ